MKPGASARHVLPGPDVMTTSWFEPEIWLLRTSIGTTGVWLCAIMMMTIFRQPARRQRVAEIAIVAGLLMAGLSLMPVWICLPGGAWAFKNAYQRSAPALEESSLASRVV